MKKAPTIIVAILILVVLCYIGMIGYFFHNIGDLPFFAKFYFSIALISYTLAIPALIYTLRSRFKEIDKEKDNDYSKYWFYYR